MIIMSCMQLTSCKKVVKHKDITSQTKISFPFYSTDNGWILIETQLKNEKKYLIFDTGATTTFLNEKYITSEIVEQEEIKDAKGKIHKSVSFKLNNFSLGDKLFLDGGVYNSISQGQFKNDSIVGILGNNIINSYVWDFDMVNKNVTISKNNFNKKFDEVIEIPLEKNGMDWSIKVLIGNENKNLIFDTGCDDILALKDTLINPNIPTSNEHKITFERLTIGKVSLENVFVKHKLNIINNLIGIPLLWEYKRVTLDFINQKIYLYDKISSINKNNITNRSKKIIEEFKKTSAQHSI